MAPVKHEKDWKKLETQLNILRKAHDETVRRLENQTSTAKDAKEEAIAWQAEAERLRDELKKARDRIETLEILDTTSGEQLLNTHRTLQAEHNALIAELDKARSRIKHLLSDKELVPKTNRKRVQQMTAVLDDVKKERDEALHYTQAIGQENDKLKEDLAELRVRIANEPENTDQKWTLHDLKRGKCQDVDAGQFARVQEDDLDTLVDDVAESLREFNTGTM